MNATPSLESLKIKNYILDTLNLMTYKIRNQLGVYRPKKEKSKCSNKNYPNN